MAGLDTELQLSGWSKTRRVVVSRRSLPPERKEEKKSKRKGAQQLTLDLPEATHQGVRYEYAVLVTSLPDEVRTIAQHYPDRGDSENGFDELKSNGHGRASPPGTGSDANAWLESRHGSTTGGRFSCGWAFRTNTPKR